MNIERTWIQNQPAEQDDLMNIAFQGEAGAHTFVIGCKTASGTSVALSGTVTGVYLGQNNVTVPLTGAISDGKAVVTLDNNCYAIPGKFIVSIYVEENGVRPCVYCGIGYMFRTQSGQVVPTQALPEVNELIHQAQKLLGVHEVAVSGNMFVIEDGAGINSNAVVDVTDMESPGLTPVPGVMSTQDVVVCNRNIHKGQSTAEFSADNLTWKLNIQFDGILPPGDYIISYHYKGLIPKHRAILSYTRYEDNQWKTVSGGYVPMDNEVTDVDEVIEDTITLAYPYSVFTYNFITARTTGITGTQYVSDIMLRPAAVTESIYTPHDDTVYTVPNNDTENTVSDIIKAGQNIVYCGSGLVHLTYDAEKYAKKSELTHVKALAENNKLRIDELVDEIETLKTAIIALGGTV